MNGQPSGIETKKAFLPSECDWLTDRDSSARFHGFTAFSRSPGANLKCLAGVLGVDIRLCQRDAIAGWRI
jgi:hypothetical protein